ncbi:GNAT family N-acetyltransferase [Actinokineospora bangkokensis]|uniref:GNAT family N-acetyltransferase n=1 Tax=Actinokineospora bangkokensis TaxID=1193682 RepID=A0A1Q9LDG2_9PSEU|nr:GNAT family N-acetyltransferase [Actinokineospora bangkokensis]OLR90044.1 GNAT family N-acetyltransferase [Actinokineospora bangkokensis]
MITGGKVRLRPLEPEDVDALWRWHNDPDVTRWLTERFPESLAELRKRFAERGPNTYERVMLGIRQLADDRLIGVCALHGADPRFGRAELDIYLGEKDAWGRGNAAEAMRLLCAYGFDELRLHSIQLTVVAANTDARRLYRRVGFREVGTTREAFRRAGQWHDVVVMDLLEPKLDRHRPD